MTILIGTGVRIAAGLAMALALGGMASAADLLERTAKGEAIRIGAANIAPHVVMDGQKQTGEALEVARKALSEMGVTNVEILTIDFGALIPALQANRIDMIASGMSITPPRCKQVAFSDPYYGKAEALIVKKGNPLGLKTYDDIAKNPAARFGHVLGGTEGPQAASAGIQESQISTYPDSATLADALKADRIDALALPDLQVNWILKKSGWEEFETPEPFVPKLDGKDQVLFTAFGFSLEDAPFRDKFNEVLDRMKKDGTVSSLVKDFAITQFGVDLAADQTFQQVCGD
jgi:polar amino acid transport system substrate-binding protein